MTANANRLTSRATPTYPARDLRAFVDAFERLGLDRATLLTTTGLESIDIDDVDGRVPCDAMGTLIAYAMRVHPMPNLGVQVAAVTPIGAFPLLDYVILTAETVGAGLVQLARYFRLLGSPTEFAIDADARPIRIAYLGPPNPFAFEFGIALALLHLADETDGRCRADAVAFAHHLDDRADVERRLGCRVIEGAGWNGWTMTAEAWTLPMRRRDAVLRAVLERHADEMLARLPPGAAIVQSVRRVLASRMAEGEPRIGTVARALGRSARSLQRDLAAEGSSYQEIVDECRRSAAERYLSDRALPIGEIAYLLGYSEPAAFHRAFRRWYGDTPQAFRRRLTR